MRMVEFVSVSTCLQTLASMELFGEASEVCVVLNSSSPLTSLRYVR